MTWIAYKVTFRLLSPMHIGWRKLGNVQQTRPYVTGRNMWGALTARLTREQGNNAYQAMSALVDEQLAFTYFYPSTDSAKVSLWPWQSDAFSWTFLGSSTSTALENSRNAEEGSLHETEFIAPYARSHVLSGEPIPVYLIGYIFARESCDLAWQQALNKLQIGGERSYGWGRVHLIDEPTKVVDCFHYDFDGTGDRPQIIVQQCGKLLAHTYVESVKGSGSIEPLVGRETTDSMKFGKNLTTASICWIPGNTVAEDQSFQIVAKGIWQ